MRSEAGSNMPAFDILYFGNQWIECECDFGEIVRKLLICEIKNAIMCNNKCKKRIRGRMAC